jgi:phosphoesterase RecJ-like protein
MRSRVREAKANNRRPMAAPIEAIRTRLENAERVVVITHVDPDGDAIGTQLAFGDYLRGLGKTYALVRDAEIPRKYTFLPGVESIVPVANLNGDLRFDTVLVLECPNHLRMGQAARFLQDGVAVVNIDHHPDSRVEGDVDWIDTRASSVGEMAFEYFQAVGYEISPEMATQLYTAILTDTGRFRFESTSPRTLAVAGELVARGADPRSICDQVYFDLDAATMLLTARVLNSIRYFEDGRICVLSLTRDMMLETGASEGSTEGLVDYTLLTKGVLVGALLKEVDTDFTKVSLRSRGNINVAEIASELGGGGHANAAGGRLKMGIEDALAEIVRILGEKL